MVTISSYTVSKLGRFLRHSVDASKRSPKLKHEKRSFQLQSPGLLYQNQVELSLGPALNLPRHDILYSKLYSMLTAYSTNRQNARRKNLLKTHLLN